MKIHGHIFFDRCIFSYLLVKATAMSHQPPYVHGDAVYIAIKNTGICGEEEIIC
jgi:hypothetical protein